ncbi:unnamed protein product [Schistosoma bovis]|nr:unnamed protein product [Schistosoma bovis]
MQIIFLKISLRHYTTLTLYLILELYRFVLKMNSLRNVNGMCNLFRSNGVFIPVATRNMMGLFNVQSRSYKMHDHLVRRCSDCYFDRREGRLYVECKKHPRHKQAQKMRPPQVPWLFKRPIWKTVRW